MGKASRNKQQKSGQQKQGQTQEHAIEIQLVPLWRRFIAMAYDGLLVISMWGLLSFIVVYLNGGAMTPEQSKFTILPLILVSNAIFYCYFWLHGGQSLGMRAWKIKACQYDGRPLTFKLALVRYALSVAGFSFFLIGYWWAIFDKQNRTLQERLSMSRSIMIDNAY